MGDYKLWKFEWPGCYSNVCGMFVATEEMVDKVVGKVFDFGEISGKHSEVFGIVEKGDITEIEMDKGEVIALMSRYGVNICGINPLDYLEEE